MAERKFKVLIDDVVVANNMDLTTAMILVKALFNEYYNDHTMMVSIKEENRVIDGKLSTTICTFEQHQLSPELQEEYKKYDEQLKKHIDEYVYG